VITALFINTFQVWLPKLHSEPEGGLKSGKYIENVEGMKFTIKQATKAQREGVEV
jgi:hypothetical protein